MCTLQLYAGSDRTNADPTKDLRGCYKRGMVIAVYDDGVCNEPPSANGNTVFVHIPGVAKSQATKYLEQTDERRRAFKVDWTTLPNSAKNALQDNREITVTLTQVKKYIRNLITEELEG